MSDRRAIHRMPARARAAIGLVVALALFAAACGGNRSTAKPASSGPGSTTSGTGTTPIIDTSSCPATTGTPGVKGNTITIGSSLPLSGFYTAFNAIQAGEQAYIDYTNANGGVTVAGKKYQIKLNAQDDQYIATKTVTNVQSMLTSNNTFALFNVVGTKNNLAIRSSVNQQCVPDLFAASGATQWGNHQYPWLIGSELVPYPLEVKTFVDYLKANKPNAKIAVLRADDDFGQSYADTLTQLVKGTHLTVVQTQEYPNAGADVQGPVDNLAATHADAFLLAGTLLACPAALSEAQKADWHPIIYMSGTCVSKTLLGAAHSAANGLLTVTPLLDPADPANASNPAMVLYKAQIAKYNVSSEPKGDASDGIVAYGWTTGALLVKTLEASPKLDRASVMETARTLHDITGAGLELPDAKWNTSANDWFVGETYQLVKWDATAGHTTPVGPVINDDGKTASLTPGNLVNQ